MTGVNAVVMIKAETSLINELAEQLAELPGVAEVFSVAGQYDLVALVRVRENEELADVISNRMTIPVDIPVHATLSRDGARILTASRDGAARLFERATGKKLGEFPGERDTLRSAEFAADEAEILLTYGDGRLVFIDAANGKQLRTSQGAPLERSDPVTQMAGDVQLVLQDGEGPSQFEVVFRGQSLGVLLAPSRIVRPILSPDGVYVFGAAIDRQAIYVFDGYRNEFILLVQKAIALQGRP